MSRPGLLAVLGLWVAAVGCNRQRATDSDCTQVLDRIVSLELHERGFIDPVLLKRKQEEMRKLLAAELHECGGKRIRPNAMQCIATAASSEDISHRCLH